jgi:hypothetical protein
LLSRTSFHVRGKLQRNRERITVHGLNDNHNKDLKNLFKIFIGYPERRKTAEVMSELRGPRASRLHRAMAVGRRRAMKGDSPPFAAPLQFSCRVPTQFPENPQSQDDAIAAALL